MSDFSVVIPARYASSRLPGKPLLEILGKPMIQHVYERGVASDAQSVVIATDDERIATASEAFGASVCMTGTEHQSGTERITEVADIFGWDDARIVVNLQGDEPAMPADLINQCARLLADEDADIATLASPFESYNDFTNPNYVKVIRDQRGHAIYFSRTAIPYSRDPESETRAMAASLHHHGIYAYRCGVLRKLIGAEPSELERCEQLEQLRALSLGLKIAVGIPAQRPGAGVDVVEDLQRVADELNET